MSVVYGLGENPTILDSPLGSLTVGFGGKDQFFIPGITVPDYIHLDKPFYVPVIGDYEPISLLIETAHMDAPYVKRVTFIGKLVAESISLELPNSDTGPFISDEESEAYTVDEAFDDLTDIGGFLKVAVSSTYINEKSGADKNIIQGLDDIRGLTIPTLALFGEAELYLYEDMEEFNHVEQLLLEGKITPIDILAYMRATKLAEMLKR